MRFGQTAVTQDFDIKPLCLAAKGALYNITGFRDQAIAAATAGASMDFSSRPYLECRF
ncbi:MAG: hypothetical protein FCKEOINB_02248 [Nitrosomonas sp.]|nr:hypothetical protein [Nitrosomonas sp.]